MLDLKLEDMNKLVGFKEQLTNVEINVKNKDNGVKEIRVDINTQNINSMNNKINNNLHSNIIRNVATDKTDLEHKQEFQPVREIKYGSIFWADINGNIGSEQGGKKYPVIIIQNDIGNRYSPTVIVAFITSQLWKKPNLPTHVNIEGYGLPKGSVVLLEQIRTIDKRRLTGYVGHVDEIMMRRIDNAKNISTSNLKPKNTLERLPKESQKYIINKIKMIETCTSALEFLHRIKGDNYSINLTEDEKFKEENSLMYYCNKNKIDYDEIFRSYNEINKKDEINNMVAL